MNILVTGGAGYIGSHAVKRLLEEDHHVVVLDNLVRGHARAIEALRRYSGASLPLIEADLLDTETLTRALREHRIEAVMNFAALTYVGESVEQPLRYYQNNTAGVLSLLQAMVEAGVRKIVHSSTAATYGEPVAMPIVETTPQTPINPYGASKLMVERIVQDHAATDPEFCFALLRYFNVAGCDPEGIIGEDHTPETHLIPVLLQAAAGKREKAIIFGDDYPTDDGTCVRDYVHVCDLADAHAAVLAAMNPALASRRQMIYNLGIGNGMSVKEIVDAARAITGVDFPVEIGPRRPGDPPALWADPSRIQDELGWQAKYTRTEEMVAHAWAWFQNHPDGYGTEA